MYRRPWLIVEVNEMEWINTVTGRIRPSELGLTLVHEHLLIGFPGWFMDTIAPFKRADALAKAIDKLQELRGLGVRTFVDPCPSDLGRDVEFMAEVAQRSGMQIICATGAYKQDQGITYTFGAMTVEQIEEVYVRELTESIGPTGICAGLVKVATGGHGITDYEKKLLTAAGRAAAQVGASVLTHTDDAQLGDQQIALLTAAGVPVHRILVGHSDGRADFDYHKLLAEHGAYVGFDRFGIHTIIKDELRIESTLKMVRAGYTRSLCLSHDATCGAWLGRPSFDGKYVVPSELVANALPDWEPTHLFKRILPKMRELGLSEADIQIMLVENPARYFAGSEPPRTPSLPLA
jgi:phosphotriesterase-related protein